MRKVAVFFGGKSCENEISVFKSYIKGTGTQTKKISPIDSRFYIKCILELLKKGGDRISSFEKMELYREAGMFSKCFEIFNSRFRWSDRDFVDELLFRAAHGDSSPFIV